MKDEFKNDFLFENFPNTSILSSMSNPLDETQTKLFTLKLFNLLQLFENIKSGSYPSTIPYPIGLVDFEMLEAELINQGILPKISYKLSQNVSREVSNLKWTTKGIADNNQKLSVQIDVPNYILKKASQSLEYIEISGFDLDYLTKQELSYLDHFARYINGAYEEVTNSYEKGLNLVLKTIKANGLKNRENVDKETTIIVLPIDKKSLAKQLFNK